MAGTIDFDNSQSTSNQDENPTQTPEERLREKVVQARYSKYETYEKLDPMEQEIIDAIMQAVKAELGAVEVAARRSQTDHLFSVIRSCGFKIDQKAVMKLSKQWNESAAKHAAELRNHFGIGEDV